MRSDPSGKIFTAGRRGIAGFIRVKPRSFALVLEIFKCVLCTGAFCLVVCLIRIGFLAFLLVWSLRGDSLTFFLVLFAAWMCFVISFAFAVLYFNAMQGCISIPLPIVTGLVLVFDERMGVNAVVLCLVYFVVTGWSADSYTLVF